MLIASTNLGALKRIWGNVIPLLLGVFIEGALFKGYHSHSGSNLLNELTNRGDCVLFGGIDVAAICMLVYVVSSASHCVDHG
jgi:hypothetical protein